MGHKAATNCYSPTNEAEDDDKDHWYEELQAAVRKVPVHDVLLAMGDMNASIPANSPGFPGSLQVFHEISRSPG